MKGRFTVIDYSAYKLRQFFVSQAAGYIDIMALESDKPVAIDAALAISWDEHRQAMKMRSLPATALVLQGAEGWKILILPEVLCCRTMIHRPTIKDKVQGRGYLKLKAHKQNKGKTAKPLKSAWQRLSRITMCILKLSLPGTKVPE